MGLSGLSAGDPRRIGQWTLVGRLGAGGMGVVYLARDADGRPAALKRLRDEFSSDPEFRTRFQREAAALLRVRGTCTVRVLAVEVETSSPFVVMEYVPGPTLAEHVREHGPLRGDMAHGFAVGLAEAVVAIHQAGLVHRDLKPGNVLLSERGPKVIDFGIAQAADATALTRTGVTVGTVGYLAPEQFRGQAGPPADVFAWALTVAYATTGRPPFGTGPAEAVLYRVRHEAPDLDGVPASLEAPLTRALSGSPERRPTSEALLSELTGSEHPRTVLDVEAVSTVLATTWQMPETSPPRVPTPPRTPGPRRRTTRAVVAAAVAGLLLATAGVLWTVLPDRDRSTGSGTAAPSSEPADSPPPSSPTASAPSTTPAATPSSPAHTPSSAPPRSPSRTTGPITNVHSGLCLDTDGPQRPGLNVQLRECGNLSGQRWRYDEATQHLRNAPSGLCLDTDGKPDTDVAALLRECGRYSGQRWRYDTDSSQFVNPASGLCLDTNGPPAAYVDLVLRACGNYSGQRWEL